MPQSELDRLLAAEFPVEQRLVYLNHAAVAPWPRRAMQAAADFARESMEFGARDYGRWRSVEDRLREQAASLINALPADIAFTKNTSEALSFVAQGFPWQTGDQVVIPAEEFPSNRMAWEALEEYGVMVRHVALANAVDPEQALLNACDAHTRLLSVSSVQYGTGLRLDLARLGRACRDRGIAFCVDAIQGLGVVPHDVEAMQIDFLMADGHKWLLGPEGLAVFYCRDAWRERLKLREHGWHMAEEIRFDGGQWRPAPSARRFECGSPNMLGIHTLSASLSLIWEIGLSEIERRVLARAELLFERIAAHPKLSLITDTRPGRYAGIVTFRHAELSAAQLHKLLTERNVVCAERGGGVRLSPHCYNSLDALRSVIDSIP